MPCKNITYFEAIFDMEAWHDVQTVIGPQTDADSFLEFIITLLFASVAITLWSFRPAKMTPNMMKWIYGFAAVTFVPCYVVSMVEPEKRLSWKSTSPLSFLICALIALFAYWMVLLQKLFYNIQPYSFDLRGRDNVLYILIGIESICVLYCLNKAPLGCVPNSKFLIYQIQILLMTSFNYLAAYLYYHSARVFCARKFVIYDEETGERELVWADPQKELVALQEELVVLKDLVKDVQSRKGMATSLEYDLQDNLERCKQATEDLQNFMEIIKKII